MNQALATAARDFINAAQVSPTAGEAIITISAIDGSMIITE